MAEAEVNPSKEETRLDPNEVAQTIFSGHVGLLRVFPILKSLIGNI